MESYLYIQMPQISNAISNLMISNPRKQKQLKKINYCCTASCQNKTKTKRFALHACTSCLYWNFDDYMLDVK